MAEWDTLYNWTVVVPMLLSALTVNVVHCPVSRMEFDSVRVSVGVFTVNVSTAEFADTAVVEWSVT